MPDHAVADNDDSLPLCHSVLHHTEQTSNYSACRAE